MEALEQHARVNLYFIVCVCVCMCVTNLLMKYNKTHGVRKQQAGRPASFKPNMLI